VLIGVLLLGNASCGKRDTWLPFGEKKSSCEKAYESLEAQFTDLKATVTGGKTSADRAAFWQAIAALFIVLRGFALVGGAALGSRARRLLPRLPGKQLANRPIGLHFEKGRFGLLARSENDDPWILHPVDRCEMKGPDVTIYLDRDYLIKASGLWSESGESHRRNESGAILPGW